MTVHSRQPVHSDELPDDLVTIEEIVHAGWCSRSKLDSRVARGVIPSYHVDGRVRVSKSETARVLEALGEKTRGVEGIARVDPSVTACDRVAKCIHENIGVLDAAQRSQLAGLLTGEFGDGASEAM